MGSGISGIYSGTYGSSQSSSPHSATSMHKSVTDWAQRMQKELKGGQKKRFNTACAVVDTQTGHTFYGRNRGIEETGSPKNPILFGDGTHGGIMPTASLNEYSVGNCAEAHAVNSALNAGAKLENLQMITVHVTRKSFGELKEACENCTYAFRGRIKGNYSG
ncbi:MAG: hypothetical protein Q4B51_03265 [Coriobacteriaceae bacterium]|nr:hypothetical protein [Coriobacteriaceae bacterium]